MAGIYIHIPFCRQACHYCNFHFSTSLKLQNDFLEALLKEIRIRRDYLSAERISTIYFGGGTPSLMPEQAIARVMNAIHEHFEVQDDAEVTFEANPDDITPESLKFWRNQSINRLSIGIQSFFEDDLKWMNRAHNAMQAKECIENALSAGFNNMSIDLIYGTPGLTDAKWEENLETAVRYGIPHLSCYALTVEPGTALDMMTRKKKVPEISNEDHARQFLLMTDYLQMHGYEHYEISNLALPGKRSKHNSSYWSGEKYLGLGPSAHSFDGKSRQWNIANNALYIQSLNNDTLQFEKEELTDQQRLNEYLMTSLRTMEGTELEHVRKNFGSEYAGEISSEASRFKNRGWMQHISDRLILTREGKLFADGIASELFVSS